MAKEIAKIKPIKERMNKTQLIDHLIEESGCEKAEVKSVLEALESTILGHVHYRGVGEFLFPGLFKVKCLKKPAKKARKNVPNPFKPGEMMDTKAKPASIKVKVNPLKKLKDGAAKPVKAVAEKPVAKKVKKAVKSASAKKVAKKATKKKSK